MRTDRSMSHQDKFQIWVGGMDAKGPLNDLLGWLDDHGVEYTFMDNACDQGSLDLNHIMIEHFFYVCSWMTCLHDFPFNVFWLFYIERFMWLLICLFYICWIESWIFLPCMYWLDRMCFLLVFFFGLHVDLSRMFFSITFENCQNLILVSFQLVSS